MAFKIQVALQGGGAKIVALLAAMEGIQRLEKSKQVEVTRVAGTSAGAVVGAMFAAGVDLASARLEFQRIVREEFWSTFKTPSWPGFVSKVMLLKKPLWDGRDLARLLRPFFDRVNVRTLGDIKKRNGVAIHTIASILSEARGTARTSENDPNGDVVSALLDSCALPFCFRIWQSTGNLTVDGGLCENLPSDELLPFEKIDGPVLAISFESAWPGTPQNAREFSMALLDTAISNSVHRAKARLGSDRVFSMKTSLTTFDFDAAGRFSQEAAELTTRQAGDFVTDFVKRQQSAARALPGDPWEDLPVQELIKWWTVFRSQHRSGSSEYEHVTMVVQANCLVEDTTNTFFDLPDFVSYSIKFSPLDKMYCSALSLLPSTDVGIALSSTGVTLRDASGNDVGFVLVPARDPASTGRRPAIVFFTPPLDASTGPYVLSFRQHVRGFLGALKEKRRNDLSLSSRSASKKSGRMNLVLHVPNSYTEARLIAKPSNPGRPMTQAEANLFSAEPGFQPIGWVAEGLPPDSKVECDVLL